MQFARSADVPKLTNYQDYRPFLRGDFNRHCAYCTIHEDELAGEDFYEIDHHRPKSKFPDLINDYANLYYCCKGCNKRGAKGENWPSEDLQNAGFGFFDPVAENAYQVHIRETKSGKLKKKTNIGDYSVRILRLNRDGLVKLRQRRRAMRIVLGKELRRLLRVLVRTKRIGYQPSAEMQTRLNLVRQALNTEPVLCLLPVWWTQ
jgi:uncharacterized protein (TIGR02646 family)